MAFNSQEGNIYKADPQLNFLSHLALALSTTCLIESENQFVPGFMVMLPFFYALFWVSYSGSGERTLKPWMTNIIGLTIAVLGTGWVVFKINQANTPLPMPTAVVPLVGPILAFLVMLRLFGPKGGRDFWILQGMGVLQVSLGCVLTTGSYFALLFFPYLVVLIWLLRRFQSTRGEEALVQVLPSGKYGVPPGAMTSVGWSLMLVSLSVVLFLVTPRSDTNSWNPILRFGQARGGGAGMGSTGFAEQMNLNKTGEIEVNSDVAFTLSATDNDGKPYLSLANDQRFRGAILEHYEGGIWNRRVKRSVTTNPAQTKLPFFGTDQHLLHFQVIPRKAGGMFLADPVRLNSLPFNRLPVMMDPPYQDQSYFVEQGSSVQFTVASTRLRQQVGYTQVVPGKVAPDRIPAILESEYLGDLISPRIPTLEEWTISLLIDMREKSRYGLDGIPIPLVAQKEPTRPAIESAYREPIARALSSYLARGGDFTYSLEIRRENPNLDPVVDFLLNVKKGHCERYASGLVLMLRSLGIPSRVIKGFRGCESQEDGTYLVRNSQAHSWVEVLVPQLNEKGGIRQDVLTGRPMFDWLTLDPTPDIDLDESASFSVVRYFFEGLDRIRNFWRDMIMDYNSEQQAEFWQRILPDFGNVTVQKVVASLPKILLGIGITLLAGVGLVIGLPRMLNSFTGFSGVKLKPVQKLFRSLVQLADTQLGLSYDHGQTPLEFAKIISVKLAELGLPLEMVQLPQQIASTLYEVRFGMNQLSMADILQLSKSLSALRDLLKSNRAKPQVLIKEPAL